MAGPLSGLRVVEMAGIGPCPLAGQLLSDMGATVTVIDRKAGVDFSNDINRRGKRSVALDLKSDGGLDVARRLISRTDILIEGFRPGVMERLSLGPEECTSLNAGLVYGRMTGWGQDGPLKNVAGHDINYLGLTGALHAMGEADKPPIPPLNLVADYGGGAMFLVVGVLAAIFERQTSGKGQVIDAAMVDGVPALMGLIYTMMGQGTWTKARHANWLDGAAPYYRCYETKDGKFVSVGPLEPQFFAQMVERMGLDPALNQSRNDPANWPEITKLLTTAFASRTRAEWEAVFDGSDACVFPVLDFHEAIDHPHNQHRANLSKQNEVISPAPAPRFSRSGNGSRAMAGVSGAEFSQILGELGLDDREIAALCDDGAVLTS